MPKIIAALIVLIIGMAFFTMERPNVRETRLAREKWRQDMHRVNAAVRQANAGNSIMACDLYKSILRDGVQIDSESASTLEQACR